MNPLTTVYHQQKQHVDLLRYRLRFPTGHGFNIPSSVDLRPWMTDIKDQGTLDSCVSNAIASSIEYLYKRYTGHYDKVSRLFIDYNARRANITQSPQQLYTLRSDDPNKLFDTNREAGIRAVQQYGFCTESLWPYDERLFQKRPSQRVYDEAARHSIVPLRIPINIVSVKTCLAHQIPVLVGILLDNSHNSQGYVQIPATVPKEGEFHACLVVGYNDQTQHFIIRNSWGDGWGHKGYFYVPYQYLIEKQFVATGSAFWAIAQLIPRERMERGFFSYPNFTEYHQQYMLPQTDKNYRKHRYQRRRYHH